VGGEIFHNCPDGPGSHLATHTMGTGSPPEVRWPVRGFVHPPPSSAEVKERAQAILLLPLWAFVACSRVNFTFT